MILTDSTAARVQASSVTGIVSVSSSFLQFMQYAAMTVSTAISGTIGLVKNGIGGLTLSGVCNYTGPTQINQGTLTVTSASTLNGVISGAGSLEKRGVNILTIGGNNTYSGGTSYVGSGIANYIVYNSSNAFGAGLFTESSGAGRIDTGSNVTLPNDFLISGTSLQYRTVGANTITITGNISGTGGINKTGNGTLDLQGTLTYTGSTTRTAGLIVASKTSGASTATATFGAGLSVSFNVPPTAGMTFRFFQGSTTNTYASVTLVGAPGRTGTYNSANSTLTIA
jgi:autotransporter-associated beta strand protein